MSAVIGIACGMIAALPFARWARRAERNARVAGLVGDRVRPRAVVTRIDHTLGRWIDRPVIRVFAAPNRRRRAHRAQRTLESELPVLLDLLGVAVGAGCTPFLAVDVAVRWGPPASAQRLLAALHAERLGRGFSESLADVAESSPALAPVVDALLTTERLGAPIAPALARLAAEQRAALRRRGEAHARRIPVRLLFPLVFLVLPAFLLLTVVPGVAEGIGRL